MLSFGYLSPQMKKDTEIELLRSMKFRLELSKRSLLHGFTALLAIVNQGHL